MDNALELWHGFVTWTTTPGGVAAITVGALLVVAIVRATPTPEDNRILGRIVTVFKPIPGLRVIANAIENALRSGKDGGTDAE